MTFEADGDSTHGGCSVVPFGVGLSGTLGIIGMSVGLVALRRRE